MRTHTRPRSTIPPVHPLRAARLAAGLTQQQVADSLEVTKATVSGWEVGRCWPLPAQAVRIHQLFPKVTLEKLYSHPRAAA